MRQRFNNQVLTTTKVVNNILRIYDQADNKGTDWYTEANMFAQELAYKYIFINGRTETFKQSVNKACGVIAALSPMKTWSQNKIIAEELLRGGDAKHTRLFVGKAKAILDSTGSREDILAILKGDKISAFFLNILKDDSVVTIDRHAVSIAINESIDPAMTSKQYEFFVNAYRVASKKRNVKPFQMQSVTWVKWRELKKQIN